jgi:hypothetical protein
MALDPETQLKIELQNIYTYIRSREYTKIFSNLSFDDYIQLAINEINDDSIKISKLTNLTILQNNLDSIIQRAKNLPSSK